MKVVICDRCGGAWSPGTLTQVAIERAVPGVHSLGDGRFLYEEHIERWCPRCVREVSPAEPSF